MEASTAPRALAEARRGEKHDVEADPPGPRGVAHSLPAAAAAEPACRRCGGRRGGCAGSRPPHSVSSLSAQVSARPGFEDVSPGLPGAPAVPHAARATLPRTRRRLTLKTRSRPSGPFCSRWSADGQVKPPWDTHGTRGSPVGLACAVATPRPATLEGPASCRHRLTLFSRHAGHSCQLRVHFCPTVLLEPAEPQLSLVPAVSHSLAVGSGTESQLGGMALSQPDSPG